MPLSPRSFTFRMTASRSGSATGNMRRRAASIRLKIAVLTVMSILFPLSRSR